MAKQNNGKGKGGGRNRNGQRNQRNQENYYSATAIIYINRAKKCQDPLKVLLKDEDGNEVKEYLPTFADGDPKGNLVILHQVCLKIAKKYDYFEEGKWKRLAQATGRALDGRCEEQWDDLCLAETHWRTGNARDQELKFKAMMQKHCRLVLGKNALNDQKDAMEAGLKYDGHDHKAMAERCYRINDQLEFFSREATKFSDGDMVRKVVYRALKDSAKVEFVRKGGMDKRLESEVLDVIEDISLTLDTAHRLQRNHNKQ